MARKNIPSIPDDKKHYFREQLYRELSNMFEWEGLPQTIPIDYLEHNLIRHGTVMYYEHENIGEDVLRAEATGFNRHHMPTQARTFNPTTNQEVQTQIFRNVKRLTDGDHAIESFDRLKDCVLINNMQHGQNAGHIVDHFAIRLAYAQQAIDTNMMWANVPYIFQTTSDDTRLSIERMFSKIFTGEPFIITDKALFEDNKDRAGVPTDIQFIGKELYDLKNEIMMDFRKTVGFETAGVDKAERVNTLEVESNSQHTHSVLNIMLQQRKIACENIKSFYGREVTVNIVGEAEMEGAEENGTNNDRIEEPSTNEF